MICHLNSFDLSKSFKVSPAEHLLLSTWRWACQVGRRGAEVHAQFNCKLLVNQANPCNSQSDNLCETLFEPHNSCPWKIIQNSLETPREHHPLGQHANIHTITHLWPSAREAFSRRSVLSGQIHSAHTESELFGNWFVGTQKLHDGFVCRWMLSARRRFGLVFMCKFQRCIFILILPIRHRSQTIRLKDAQMSRQLTKLLMFVDDNIVRHVVTFCRTYVPSKSMQV